MPCPQKDNSFKLRFGVKTNKWLVSMSAAAVAAGAMAVESQNIVGVQEFDGTAQTLISAVPTFLPVGTDGTTMSLGDITVNAAFQSGSDAIRLYAANGDVSGEYTYVYANSVEGEEGPDGWYLMTDYNNWDFTDQTCQNGILVPFGTGLVFAPANVGAQLIFKGEVKEATTTVAPTAQTLCRTGNSSPVNLTLGDIAVNAAFESGSDAIRLYAANGDVSGEYTYVYANSVEGEEGPDGWYLMTDYNNWDFTDQTCQNAISIPAGAGFVFAPANSGAAIVIPNPLAE